MTTVLRAYQLDLVDRVEASAARSVLMVAPTGSGKTTVYEELARRELARGGRVVLLADREELIRQAHDRMGGDVLMASYRPTPGVERPHTPGLTIASVATLARRDEAPDATLAFTDEAHCFLASSFKRVADAYRGSGAKLVGGTATPARLDGQGLGLLFEEVVQGPSAEELIRDGWLVPVRTFAPVGSWWDKVKLRGGDFASDELEEAASAVVKDVAARWRELGGADRPTLVFASTKAHARQLAEEFGDAEVVTDDTPTAVRRSIRDRIQDGTLRVVVTVGVLGTGFDAPAISCIVSARPTLSWALHLQQGGRGLRTWPGKQDCMIVDCAGNSLRHGLLTRPFAVSLEGVTRAHRRAVAGLTTCRRCFRVYEWTEPACPGCGTARPRSAVRRVKEVDGQLVELTGAQAYAERTEGASHASTLAKWMVMGKRYGWKPGAPFMRFKGQFKRSPSREEVERATAMAASA